MDTNVKVNRSEIAAESNPNGVQRPSGLYRHPETGAELVALTDPLYGDPQAAAAERVGFKYVGPVPEGYVKTVVTASDSHAEQPARAVEAQDAYNKGVEARLNALEAENARLKAGQQPEAVKGAEDVKQAAADRTELQTGQAVDVSTGEVSEGQVDTNENTDVVEGSAEVKPRTRRSTKNEENE